MLADGRLTGFVPTTDFDAARRFYGEVLGLRLASEDGFALTYDANGSALRVTRVEALTPQPFTVLGWWVDDLETAVADLRARGVVPLGLDGTPLDGEPWRPPGSRVGVAWFRDPAGNLLSVTGFVA